MSAQAQLRHVPVLLRESIELLDPRAGETVIDCTAGLGGHAAAIAERIGAGGTVVLFDLDPMNLEIAERRVRALPGGPNVVARHASFAEVGTLCQVPSAECQAAIGPASVMLADLGFASPQVDDPVRGFSFLRDGPLDMRMDPKAPVTAAELANSMTEQDLAGLIREYGEEPPAVARRIASKVVQERKGAPIQTTSRLAEIIRAAMPGGRAAASSIHPATKTFQALRIAVNDEIGNLERLLESVRRAAVAAAEGRPTWLAPAPHGARVGIISFHSLEDRPVKRAFAGLVDEGLAEHLTRKPITADDEEVAANPRARSAKFRAIRLTGQSGRR